MPTSYINATIFTGEVLLKNHAVNVDNGLITSIVPTEEVKENHEIIDLKGAYMAPALIDLQVYGGNGQVFSLYPSVKSLKATYEACKKGGAAYFMPTVATISDDIVLDAIRAVRAYWEKGGKGVLGLHLEGPFINPAKKGAHRPEYIRQPTQEDIDMILENEDVVKMITLAPECCDPALVKQLQDAGIIVYAGHSNATYAEAYTAFNNGIHHATHLFNAMSPLESRAPGLVGAIYDHPEVYASIVADGIHVDFAAVRISKKIMGNRLYLITDAVEENKEGDFYIYLKEKDRFVNDAGVLAGSRLTMLQAVRNCAKHKICSMREAIRMASLYPAQALGLENRIGRIAPGCEASFLVIPENGETVVYC
ncbi:N-acetylglucosamine-6-phosphate deacetylase [Chitinophaga sp. Cy-1792]|uniref:N-acetylglucosamine-6-phosphate deacetylase n=1 Tax=Chitinophaga sp. Cy-1792 TaxID=2608339 RepID=UPI001423D005|nr:N-acetylglucosamine-6-phosphate deacetylase [Chitinophaga sp. Cy-1792]NIG52155.1 N-acetylglucosamine-6-phosphate deacetylase [Chitinophaga sp. Cy-1792]